MGKEDSKAASKVVPEGDADASAKAAEAEAKKSGRVKFDDRGMAIWEWSVATGAFGLDVTSERLRKLENPALSIADDAPTPRNTVRANPLGAKKGYDPYDSGKLGKREPPKKKDLRRLSEWLKLKKQADGNNPDDQ